MHGQKGIREPADISGLWGDKHRSSPISSTQIRVQFPLVRILHPNFLEFGYISAEHTLTKETSAGQ